MSIANDGLVTQLIQDIDILHQIANGDATTVVETEGGPVRSVAKLIADNQNYINTIPLKEDIANKVTTLGSPSDTTYPSTQAVVDYVTNAVAATTTLQTNNIQSSIVVDSISTKQYSSISWLLQLEVINNGSAQRELHELRMLHDGTSSNDATMCPYTIVGTISTSSIDGVTISTVLSGIGTDQVVQLVVSSTGISVNASVVRSHGIAIVS